MQQKKSCRRCRHYWVQQQRSWRAWLRVGVIKGLWIHCLLCGRCLAQHSACDTACYQTALELRENRVLLPGFIQKPGEFLAYNQAQVTMLLPSVHASVNKSMWLQICTALSSPATYSGSNFSTEIFAVRKERHTPSYHPCKPAIPLHCGEKKNSGETLFISFLISFKVW